MTGKVVNFTGLTIKRRDLSGGLGLRQVRQPPSFWTRVQWEVDLQHCYNHKKNVVRLIEQQLNGRWALANMITSDKVIFVAYFENTDDAVAFMFYGGTSPDESFHF